VKLVKAEGEGEEEEEKVQVPALYYPSESWDEPVRQGIRVVWSDSQVVSYEFDYPETLSQFAGDLTVDEGDSEAACADWGETVGEYKCLAEYSY
jgi:hypothetical protein